MQRVTLVFKVLLEARVLRENKVFKVLLEARVTLVLRVCLEARV